MGQDRPGASGGAALPPASPSGAARRLTLTRRRPWGAGRGPGRSESGNAEHHEPEEGRHTGKFVHVLAGGFLGPGGREVRTLGGDPL